MKSNHAVIAMALFFLALATLASAAIWADVSSPAKVGMFAFGFGAGVAAGTLIARRKTMVS
jgi:hypothetical protein